MKRYIFIIAAIYLTAVGLLFGMAPGILTMIILGAMTIILLLGFLGGTVPSILYAAGFTRARKTIESSMDIQSTEPWLAVFNIENLFGQKDLDAAFRDYKSAVEQQKENGDLLVDIDDYINEEFMSIRTWRSLTLQIPGTMTGLGILGTFIGLITGVGTIGFSTVEAALESISNLLSGIETAFYTSIAGVILSILFNILDHAVWNATLREYDLFVDTYHRLVLPSVEVQERNKHNQDVREIIALLERIPKRPGFSLSRSVLDSNGKSGDDTVFMEQVLRGLQNNEFLCYLQPYVNLQTKEIVRAEALVRWNHEVLGLLPPSAFLPVLEKNGFITKLDSYIWEYVCFTIQKWIRDDQRPIPISVNLSEMDIMAMDVPGFFSAMLEKYNIPPRLLEIEIAQGVYENNFQIVNEAAGALRRLGLKVLIDGFDGDYISMNMLRGVEADELVFDLENAGKNEKDFVKDVCEQAKKIGIDISVKNVENAEQIAALNSTDCTIGQGLYFYRPVSIEEFENITE